MLISLVIVRSRDRPKSAPYPKLKNSEKFSKCQVFFYSTRKSNILPKKKFRKNYILKKWTEWRDGARFREPLARWKGDTSEIVNIFVAVEGVLLQNIKKLKRGNFLFSGKNLTVPKKLKGGPFGVFQHLFCRKTKKIKGGTFGEKISGKKVSQCRKKIGRGTLWNFPTSILSQNRKLFRKKSLSMPKQIGTGDPSVWYGTRENRKNFFGSVR